MRLEHKPNVTQLPAPFELTELSERLPRYEEFDPDVPVWCLTPDLDGCIHRFFDTAPVSPSGRYVGLTQLPFEDRAPEPGDAARVVVVDLETGEQRVVAQTRGWDTQLGAQVQWGRSDSELFFNDLDLDTWRPFGVKLDPVTGACTSLDGTVYMVSRDGRFAASPDLRLTGKTQRGYGVLLPEDKAPLVPADADGLFVTDTTTGRCDLLVSLEEIAAAVGLNRQTGPGRFGAFHVKWNPQGDRLMLVLAFLPVDGRQARTVVTMRSDGSDICAAVTDETWQAGGHHPDWCPDGATLTMNLVRDDVMRLCRVRYDGTGLETLSERIVGSGHPTLHPDGRHVVTDAYLKEPMAYGDGTTPIRWFDLEAETECSPIRINNDPPFPGPGGILRVDPHPAWDRRYRWIVFNGCDRGVRRVYLADMTKAAYSD